GGAPARGGGINNAGVGMDNFDPAAVTKLLVSYGLKQQEGQGRSPLVTYISLRMPNRGGAEGGTPELYFTDPGGELRWRRRPPRRAMPAPVPPIACRARGQVTQRGRLAALRAVFHNSV